MTASDRKLKDISLILKDLLKVIKVVSMYPEDNPLPQSLRRSFSEKLESIVDDYGEMRIEVQAQSLIFEDNTVFQNTSKEENLAGIFFSAGITEITFKPGLDVLEIYKLLDVIKNYMNAPDKTQDLAALIWEAGIGGLNLKTLEDIALSEYDNNFNIQEYAATGGADRDYESFFGSSDPEGYTSIFTSDEESGKWETSDFENLESLPPDYPGREYIRSDDESGGRSRVAPEHARGAGAESVRGNVRRVQSDLMEHVSGGLQYAELQDSSSDPVAVEALGEFSRTGEGGAQPIPDSTLILNDEFKLSEEEEEIIRGLMEQDASFDPYASTINLLQEMFLQEMELPGFSETTTICEKIMGEFVRLARLAEASSLLEHLKKLEARIRKEKPMWADRLKEAIMAAGSRGRLETLAYSLNENPDINPVELERYLKNFGWEALAGITELVGQLEHRQHRNTVLAFLSERGKDNLDLIARGVSDRNLDVVRNAMSILAEVASDKALRYLTRLTKHSDTDIRRQLVLLLRDCRNESAILIPQQMVGDPDPQIRRGAVNSIVSKRGQLAFDAITNVINNEQFPALAEDDQQALLNAFSILGGEKAVSYLSELITTFNHFRSRTLAFLRSAAFEALVVNRSEKAEQLLLKLARSWRPDIKNQALLAIQRRSEGESGDSQW